MHWPWSSRHNHRQAHRWTFGSRLGPPRACDEPLVLRVDEDSDEEAEGGVERPGDTAETVPDDLELGCSCHFHWQCLMDESAAIAISLKCPSCDTHLPVNEAGPSTTNPFLQTPPGAVILARYTNEGGLQDGVDLLPSITEEAYLDSHPKARPARAFQVMCSEGDAEGIVQLLRDAGDDVPDVGSLIRYQDPLSDMKSGLHLAVENTQEEVVWLLIWLSSVMPTAAFPEAARQAAESSGVGRLTVTSGDDIRGLRDGQGRTAEDLAAQLQGSWTGLLESGILSP